MFMAFRQWIMACSGPATNRMEGLCARLRDAVHEDDMDEDDVPGCGCGEDVEMDDAHSLGHKSALWKDLTLSAMEPAIPTEISIPAPEDIAAITRMYSSLEEDGDTGLVNTVVTADLLVGPEEMHAFDAGFDVSVAGSLVIAAV